MTAGRIILTYNGKNSSILVGNPDINFWKASYTRYTNFSMQSIELECDDKIIPTENKHSIYRFKVHRYADLINYMHLTINLPRIYSDQEEFKWCDYVGCAMINYARLYFDNNLIEEIDGRYLYVYNSLYNDKNKSDYFNKLVGNIDDLNNPYINNTYKAYTDIQYTTEDNPEIIYPNKFYNTQYSIPEYQLNIPLLFTVFRNNNNLPLISLSKTEVFIEISIKPIKDLYTIVKPKDIDIYYPTPSIKNFWNHQFNTNLKDTFKIKKRVRDSQSILRFTKNRFKMNNFIPKINANYIFLDDKERNMFATLNIKNLQVFNDHIKFSNVSGLTHLESELYHPIKNLIILAQRTDVNNRNEWLNFSNLDSFKQDSMLMQNIFLEYAKNESIYNNDELYSYIYQLTNIEGEVEQTLLNDDELITTYNNVGFVENVTIVKSADFYSKNPVITIDNVNASNFSATPTFSAEYSIIKEKGTYKTIPNINILTPNLGDDLKLDIGVNKDIGGLNYINILNKGSKYSDIIDISIDDTYDLGEINVINEGEGYTSQNQLNLEDRIKVNIIPIPNENFSKENVDNLDISDCKLSPVFSGGRLLNINIDDIGSKYNLDILKPEVYIGGNLDLSNNPISYDDSKYGAFTEIPTIHFFDNVNKIIAPKLNLSLDGSEPGNLKFEVSGDNYISGGNYGENGNYGYGLSKNTVIRTGTVVDTITFGNIVDNFKVGLDFYEPKVALFNNLYPQNLNIKDRDYIKYLDNIWFSNNTYISPEFNIELEGDSYGLGSKLSLEFNNTYIYTNDSGDYVYQYPKFYNNVINTETNNVIINLMDGNFNEGVFVANKGTLKFDCSIYNTVSNNVYGDSDSVIDNKTNVAITTLNIVDDSPVLIKKDKLSSTLTSQDTVEGTESTLTLSLPSSYNSTSYKLLMTQNINSEVNLVDVTSEYDEMFIFNYRDINTNKNKSVIAMRTFRNTKDSGSNTSNYTYNKYNQKDTVFSLYINDKYIDSIVVTDINTVLHFGLNSGDYPYQEHIDFLDITSNTLSILCFSNLETISPITTEAGKSIKGIKIDNPGYGFKNIPAISIRNADNEDNLNFNISVLDNPSINTTVHENIELKPIIDYQGIDGKYKLNINKGGSVDKLDSYISFRRHSLGIIIPVFNSNYYGNSVYDNLYLDDQNNSDFNYFVGNKIWSGYTDEPIFISKLDPDLLDTNNLIINDSLNDIVFKGILDYGGSGAQILTDIDFSGRGGQFTYSVINNTSQVYNYVNPLVIEYPNNVQDILTNNYNNLYDNIYLNIDNVFIDFNLSDSGIGYEDSLNGTSYLKATLIKYKPNQEDSSVILRQYNLNVENGFIVPFTNNMYLCSNLDDELSYSEQNTSYNLYKGIILVKDNDWPNFINFRHYNYGNNIRDYYDIINEDPNNFNLSNDDNDPNNIYLYRLKLIVGGIVNKNPIILEKGQNYGSIIEGSDSLNNIIRNGLENINSVPHIYNVVNNGFKQDDTIKFGILDGSDILTKTSINNNNEIDEVLLDISKITTSNNYTFKKVLLSDTSSYDLSFTSKFSLYTNNYMNNINEITRFFYIDYNELKNYNSTLNNDIYNETQTNIESILIGKQIFGLSKSWSRVYSDIKDGYYPNDGNTSILITDVSLAEELNNTTGKPSKTWKSIYNENINLVKIFISPSFPSSLDWKTNIDNYGSSYKRWNITFDDIIHIANTSVTIDNIIDPETYITNTSDINGIIEREEEINIITPLLSKENFVKKVPNITFGKQLTSFDVINSETTDSKYNLYVDNVCKIFSSAIDKPTDINIGKMYNIFDNDNLGVTLNNGDILFKNPIIDNYADRASITLILERKQDYTNYEDQNKTYFITGFSFNKNQYNEEMRGQNYISAPKIYLVDKYTDEVYEDVMFCDLNSTNGSISNIDFDSNVLLTKNVIAIIGGHITNLFIQDYFKIPISLPDSIAVNDILEIENEIIPYENMTIVPQRSESSNYTDYYNIVDSNLKIGGNITSLFIKTNGSGYLFKPNIFALNKINNDYILDESFNQIELNYNIVNGSIVSFDNIEEIKVLVNIVVNDNGKPSLIAKNIHDKNTKILTGGTLLKLDLINSINTLDYNKNFTSKSKINIGSRINNIKINDIGSEIDESDKYKNQLFVYQDIGGYKVINKQYTDLLNCSFKGSNISTKNLNFIPNMTNIGNGSGATAAVSFTKGTGGDIQLLCSIDDITINNQGSGYNRDKVIISNKNNLPFNITYKWQTLPKSLIFNSTTIAHKDIIKFNYNWIYRDSINIPIINSKNIREFYTENIINDIELLFNNKPREFIKNSDLYSLLEGKSFWKNNNNNNLYLYSFSLDNNSNQPKGSCNFSHVKDLKLTLRLKEPPKTEKYKYNIYVYFEYYNVLEFMNGIGAIKFSN